MRRSRRCPVRKRSLNLKAAGDRTDLLDSLHRGVRSTTRGVTIHGLCTDAVTGWLDRRCRLYVLRIIKQHSMLVGGQMKFLLRFAINNAHLGVEFPLFEALKIKAYEQFPDGIGSHLLKLAEANGEVTVQEDEASAFAPWVVKWLNARAAGRHLPPPPYPLLPEFDLGNKYQYSVRAKAAYDLSRGASAG